MDGKVFNIDDPEMGLKEHDAIEETVSLHADSSSLSDEELTISHYSHLSTVGTSPALGMFRKQHDSNFIYGKDGSFFIYLVLFIATLVFTVANYLIVGSNQSKFLSAFESSSRELSDLAQTNKDTIFGQLRSAALEVTALSTDSKAAPNITLQNFDRRSSDIVNATGIDMVLYVPLIETIKKSEWESYAVQSQGWIAQDFYYRGLNISNIEAIPQRIYGCQYQGDFHATTDDDESIAEEIFKKQGYKSGSMMAPIAQFGPAISNSSLAMMDLFSHPVFRKQMLVSLEYNSPVLSEPIDFGFLFDHVEHMQSYSHETRRSFIIDPIKETFRDSSKTVGFIIGILSWESIFEPILPMGVDGLQVVVDNGCNDQFTLIENGGKKKSTFVNGDIHDPRYDKHSYHYALNDIGPNNGGLYRSCSYSYTIYASDIFRESFHLIDPSPYAGLIVVAFVLIASIFFIHNLYTQKKQDKALDQVKRVEAIVTSVFPKEVGLRLIEQAHHEAKMPTSSKKMLNIFLARNGSAAATSESQQRRKPIADLFPSTTVMFADIAGFTAWSSTREPSQVFILLETIYKEFDILAKRRGVFKVETVGDCYVAVCGLPEPKRDHPVAMCLFAVDCLASMSEQVHRLEEELGPDTAELGLRIGLHSGPVTAGVLRGDRARFQLFGDAVNTCARVETSGEKNRIHISKDTADLLKMMGKGHWTIPRTDKVYAKGKGEIQTYWMKNLQSEEDHSNDFSSLSMYGRTNNAEPASTESTRRLFSGGQIERKPQDLSTMKFDRMVTWNVDVLKHLLRQVEKRRLLLGMKPEDPETIKAVEKELSTPVSEGGTAAFEEVVECIEIATFNAKANGMEQEQHDLSEEVQKELFDYVRVMAKMYNDNPFHNFEHASHVTMSVMKLLSRIVAPDIEGDQSQLHDHTYGITSDPLTQFAVVLSALLHDLDHLGVANSQLVKEVPELARMYKDKSVAEQNSIDLAWALLMEDRFENLRRSIYSTTSELRRFRQLVVNTILATDIMDKELKALRNAKWDKAFSQEMIISAEGNLMEVNNRKATVVIEHLIQASDIAHTMQHWQVYRKWNQRLFREMYRAYREGHADKDPSEGWYEGEIGFFDFYIIPLAKKLHECGVFGVSSHEYLNYAQQNRQEWEKKGRSVVAQYIEEIQNEDALANEERHSL